jgi:Fe-S cluster assembly protein SufD
MSDRIIQVDSKEIAAQFGGVPALAVGADLPWLESMRRDALARLAVLGLPTQRVEAWKFTNLRPLTRHRFEPAEVASATANVDLLPSLFPAKQRVHRVVFVNGRFRPDLSRLDDLPAGLQIDSLAGALAHDAEFIANYMGRTAEIDDKPFLSLNMALMADGFVVRVAENVEVSDPIEVVHLGGYSEKALSYHPRCLVVLETGARARLIEHHVGQAAGVYFANHVAEIEIGAGACLNHIRVQAESADGFHLTTLNARIARDAAYRAFGLSTGARLSRLEAAVSLVGEGAHCSLGGAYLMRGGQHCDNTTVIEHCVPNTSCNEVFKGVLDDKARAVFQGRLKVHPQAQKTDGRQLNKTILLSDDAEIDSKPELEIYADDVKCSHGATAGELDGEQLFYLRSRGLREEDARRLLIKSFLAEAVDTVVDEDCRDALTERIASWLSVKGDGA